MGTSASTTKTSSTDPGPFLTNDLPRYIVETELPPGSGRMLRGYRIRSSECGVLLVCKATVVRYNENESNATNQSDVIRESISNHSEELKRIWELIGEKSEEFPNVLPYQRWMISSNPIRDNRSGLTSQPVYLMRQHCYATLSDRLALRPFLTIIEKTWIAYQILRALQAIHAIGVCHGHLTCENVCVTSYGWVLLTDFGSVKPVCIPDYDLGEYILHFEKEGSISNTTEKRCYLAPERFYSRAQHAKETTKSSSQRRLTPAMDIFSTGCVLMETFLNGEKALDIGDLMDYRNKGSIVTSLKQKLNKIESSSMRAACKHMISLDPKIRLSPSSYITRLSTTNPNRNPSTLEARSSTDDFVTGTTKETTHVAPIPDSFYDFLWPLIKRFRYEIYSPDARIALLARSFGDALKMTVGVSDLEAQRYFKDVLGDDDNDNTESSISNGNDNKSDTKSTNDNKKDDTIASSSPTQPSLDAWSNKFQTLLKDTESLLKRLEEEGEEGEQQDTNNIDSTEQHSNSSSIPTTSIPVDSNNNTKSYSSPSSTNNNNIDYATPSSSSLLIYIQLVLSTIRFVQRPSSKIIALQLLSHLCKYSTDETRLQRIVPLVVSMLDDNIVNSDNNNAMVKATCIRVLSTTLERIQMFPPSDAKLFEEYIFKRVGSLISCDDKVVVRVAFSECISSLAETAKRFLDVNHAMRLYETIGSTCTSTNSADILPVQRSTTAIDVFPEFPDLLPRSDNSNNATKGAKTITPSYQQEYISALAINNKNSSTIPKNLLLNCSDYDDDLTSLQETISRWIVQITTDNSSSNNKNNRIISSAPKRALLQDLTRLCSFFGRDGVISRILPQILAFLNDRNDWQLRSSLCRNLPSVCSIIGIVAVDQFVLPVIETALTDDNVQVIHSALICLRRLVKMGLLARSVVLGTRSIKETSKENDQELNSTDNSQQQSQNNFGIIEKYSPFLLHPSEVVRHGIASFICGCCQVFRYPDDKVFVLPIIKPYIRYEPSSKDLQDVTSFLSCVLPPIRTHHKLSSHDEIMKQHNNQANDNNNQSKKSNNHKMIKQLWNNNTAEGDEEEHQKKTFCSSSAYKFTIPNQKYLESCGKRNCHPLPDWYYFRYIFQESSLKLKIKHLSVPFLIHVYGLSMTSQSATSLQTIRKSKHGNDLSSFEIVQDGAGAGQHGISTTIASSSLFGNSTSEKGDGKNVNKDESTMLKTTDNYQYLDSEEWGAVASLDPSLVDASMLLSKLKCLRIPPLPPRLGVLREVNGKPFSCHGPIITPSIYESNPSTDSTANTSSLTKQQQNNYWKPKTDSLLLSTSLMSSHKGAVTRLAVSQDNSFFVSASHDGTSQVFELRHLDDAVDLQSSLVYTGHSNNTNSTIHPKGSTSSSKDVNTTNRNVRLNDVCIIENSHSVATADSNGSLHVWRIETTKSKDNDRNYYDNCRISGNTLLRNIDKRDEGEILSISHFNTSSSSILLFATQMGYIHSWDLRCPTEPFCMKIRPELGYLTSNIAVGSDRHWMVTGTSRGFLSLWDLRYQTMVKLWQNDTGAPIQRLATCYTSLPSPSRGKNKNAQQLSNSVSADDALSSPKPYIFMGSGLNESSVYDVSTGACRQCFRVLDPSLDYVDQSALPSSYLKIPYLKDIALPSHPNHRILPALNMATQSSIRYRHAPPEPSITVLIGRLGSSLSGFGGRQAQQHNYLITGGTDRRIRYWDFTSPSKCYTISGLFRDELRPTFESVDNSSQCQLFLCRQKLHPANSRLTNSPSAATPSDRFAPHEKAGSSSTNDTSSTVNQPVNNSHHDAILDLKTIDFPVNGLLSSSRDGTIKLWN